MILLFAQSLSTSVLSGRAGFALDIDDTYADGLTAASRLYGPRGLDVASDGQVLSQILIFNDSATDFRRERFAQQENFYVMVRL